MAKQEWKDFGTSLAQGTISDVGSGFVSNLISLPFNILYQRQALKNDKERMNYQASLNREQYMLEHSMESPIAMRANLEDANLNPALMYSQGGLASGMNATVGPSSSSTSAPHTAVSAKQTSLNNLLGLQRLTADIENVQADTEAKLAQAKYNRTLEQVAGERRELGTNLLRAQWHNQEIRNKIDEIERLFATELNEANIAKIKAATEDLRNQIINRDITTANDAKRASAYVDEVNGQLEKWNVDNAYTKSKTTTENETREVQINKLKSEVVRINWQNLLDSKSMDKIDAEIEKLGAQVNLTNAQIKQVKASVHQRWAEIAIKGAKVTSQELREWTVGSISTVLSAVIPF